MENKYLQACDILITSDPNVKGLTVMSFTFSFFHFYVLILLHDLKI